jgi:3-oxoacyl-[acyl-carrier protein] reductase
MDDQVLAGKVAVVTGAGAGLGRAEALALAAAGADVVVNDVGEDRGVVDEIGALGQKAVFVQGDVAERSTADELVEAATRHFGDLNVVVNNAGVLRDRMLFNMSDQEWDQVIAVHLRGHFLLTRNASAHWRQRSKEDGAPVCGRLINTASEAWLFGAEGQPNYAAAKAGISALTLAASRGLSRYGVRANTICPRARTDMTADIFGPAPEDGADPLSLEHVAPFVVYLASPAADAINGQVFVVHGGMVALLSAPAVEQRFDTGGATWSQHELDERVGGHFAQRDPQRTFAAADVMGLTPRSR